MRIILNLKGPKVRSKPEEGSSIITVLWVLAVLALAAATFAFSARLGLLATHNFTESIKARALAEAGVQAAAAALLADEDTGVDSLKEEWHTSDKFFKEVEIGEGNFSVICDDLEDDSELSYGIVDEASKININVATREMLAALPWMSLELADCILDWIDADYQAREAGAEDDYYEALPEPYKTRNAKLVTVRELLLVKGFDEAVLYGEDTNGNGILDANENDGESSEPDDNADGRLDRGIMGYVTVYSYDVNKDKDGNSRLNLNSAGEKDIKDKLKLTDEEARQVKTYRDNLTNDEFTSIGQLLDIKKGGDEGQRSQAGASEEEEEEEEEENYLISDDKFEEIADLVTVTDDSRIEGLMNVNTACKEVLEALDDVDATLAESIIAYRDSAQGPFDTIGELIKVDGMTRSALKGIIARVTVRSHNFRVISRGILEDSRAVAQIEAIIERADEKATVRYWKQMH